MKSILKLTLAASVAMIIATGCSKSNGSSSSDATPLPPVLASGKLADGYLSGALIFADCNGNKTFQSKEEPSTISDASGDYSLSIPDSCKYATLIASGGSDLSVSPPRPFSGVLMAPAGSKNITPLTTLVAVDPSFASKLGVYDVDFVNTGISQALLDLAQQVAASINIISSTTKISDISVLINKIVEPIASSLANVDLNKPKSITNHLVSASTSIFTDIEQDNPDMTITDSNQIATDLNTTLSFISSTIQSIVPAPDGTVTLDPINSTIASSVTDGITNVSDSITLPIIKVTDIKIGANTYTPVTNTYTVPNAQESDINTSFTATIIVADAVSKTYTTDLTLLVADKAPGNRSAQIIISNVSIQTSSSLNPSQIVIPNQQLTATVTGTDSTGANFTAVSLTDDQLSAILVPSGNEVTVKMNVLLDKIKSNAGSGHPLNDFLIPGEYLLTVSATGDIPMEYINYLMILTIQ